MLTGQSDVGIFTVEVPSYKMTHASVKLTKELSSTQREDCLAANTGLINYSGPRISSKGQIQRKSEFFLSFRFHWAGDPDMFLISDFSYS